MDVEAVLVRLTAEATGALEVHFRLKAEATRVLEAEATVLEAEATGVLEAEATGVSGAEDIGVLGGGTLISIYLAVGSKVITVEGGAVGMPGRRNGKPDAVWQE